MYCRVCLYNLSHTMKPRCPECGASFNPRNHSATTLPTSSRWRWTWFHALVLLRDVAARARKSKKMFCRECFADLRDSVHDRCPACEAWFCRHDCGSYRTSNTAFAKAWERFRHVCIWRGVLLPLVPLSIGIAAVVTRHTLLPGADRFGFDLSELLPLDGWPAASMGWAWIGLAFAIHVHFFWGRVDPFWRFALLGVFIGIAALFMGWMAALGWAIQHVWN